MRGRYALVLLMSFASLSSAAFALDDATITFIHSETKSALADKCNKDMVGVTPAVCDCLADKAQANLDDKSLKNCPDKGKKSQSCISKIVETAVLSVLTKENSDACIQQTQSQSAPATSQPSANQSPQAQAPATDSR